MAMRMSGLVSGMDTETIVQQLVEVRSAKVKTVKNDNTKLEWKQEIWQGLNSKLKTLQSKLNELRFSSGYAKKVTKASNANAVSILTGENAVIGVQELKINQLAKTAYLTGGKVELKDGVSADTALNSETAMGSLMNFETVDGEEKPKTLKLKIGESAEKEISLTSATTISEVLKKLKDEGLNANFDQTQKRFYISAKESGKAGNFTLSGDGGVLTALGLKQAAEGAALTEKDAKYITGQDAEIELNGVKYTNTNNTFEINGLTITANSANANETITLSTQQDTEGIYNKIKDFFKTYNEIINEIDKLYNAKTAKGYEPLTDEEKSKMSETEAEKYEQKIKDALLRKDISLGSIGSELKKIMASSFSVPGKDKQMALTSFGIETLGYFYAKENERNAYHILGNADDADVAAKEDKLKSMIASDPDAVVSFFSQLATSLYKKMDEMSSSVEGYRSFGSFYDDKKMKTDLADYKVKIKEQEKKLADYEDKWYAKFAAMETALAKMQQNASAVTGLIGGSQ